MPITIQAEQVYTHQQAIGIVVRRPSNIDGPVPANSACILR